ncbi:MAG: dipeptidase, partial [Chloroflexota bacterium]
MKRDAAPARMTTAPFPPILDGHNDTLLALYLPERSRGRDFFEHGDSGHIDLPRARDGGLGGAFFAVFVPSPAASGDGLTITGTGYEVRLAEPLELAYAQSMTIAITASLFRLEARSGGQLRVVRTVAELAAAQQDGVLAAILHFEGAESIDPDLDALEVFYRAGLRSLGLVWSRPNAFGHGVPFRFPVRRRCPFHWKA